MPAGNSVLMNRRFRFARFSYTVLSYNGRGTTVRGGSFDKRESEIFIAKRILTDGIFCGLAYSSTRSWPNGIGDQVFCLPFVHVFVLSVKGTYLRCNTCHFGMQRCTSFGDVVFELKSQPVLSVG